MEGVVNNKNENIGSITTAARTVLSCFSAEVFLCWELPGEQLLSEVNVQLMGYDGLGTAKTLNWWKGCVHQEDRTATIASLDAFVKSGREDHVHAGTCRFICEDGSYKFIELHGILRKSEGGETAQLGLLMRDVTEFKKLQKKLEEQDQMFKRQVDLAVMDAQQNERRKLAEELHDNVNQLLGVVKLYIEHSITNENIREGLLKKSNQYIDKVIEELRNLSKNLAPPLLAELGLEHSLTSLAESIAEVQQINIWVEMDGFNDEGIADNHKLMIYRIVQEQLNNIIKHADAQNATIQIGRQGNRVYMSISDDGKGTELTQEFTNGLGLRHIKNRIELFHGKMQVISSPDNGFRLNVEFEITNDGKES